MNQAILDLIDISKYAGCRADYTQGGGGNTSVKDEKEGIMFIKASGYKLKDISYDNAFVAVNRNSILDFYNSANVADGRDYEKLSAENSKASIIQISGMPALRPSVEVGFHSILKKYVIHTHSVYANIITCCEQGEQIAKELFGDCEFGYIFLPYINPGFELTLRMKEEINKYCDKNGKFPEVIFMKNHGLVVTSDYLESVKSLNTFVNNKIIEKFNLKTFDKVELKETKDGIVSETEMLKDYILDGQFTIENLNKYPLYPDQLVYLNNALKFAPDKMQVKNGKLYYSVSLNEALTLEETLTAYAYVVTMIKKAGFTIYTMNKKEVDFINNWEAEKYRRSVK